VREKVWLENSLSQTFSHINTPKYSNLVVLHTYPAMKMEQTECSETSAHKIQMPGNYPKKAYNKKSVVFVTELHLMWQLHAS